MASTLVIGIGGAGTRMLAEVERRAEEEEVGDKVELLAVDSKTDDIDPVNNRIVFEEPDDFDTHKTSRFYLQDLPDDANLPAEGGATKHRPIGRYYVDTKDNFQNAYNTLEGALERAGKRATGDDEYINVFVLNAFGGGTGSGSYMLIAALTKFILEDSFEDQNYRIRGFGTLPRLRESGTVPDTDARHHINGYAALRELRTLLGRHPEDHEHDILSLKSEPPILQDPELTVSSDTFHEFFLLGYDEESENVDAHRKELNELVADLIIYYGLVEGPEDFPRDDLPQGARGEIVSIRGAHLYVPIDELCDYLEADTEIKFLKRQIERAEEQAEKFRKDQRYIDSVLELDPGAMPEEEVDIDEQTEKITRDFVNECRDRAEDFLTKMGWQEELKGGEEDDEEDEGFGEKRAKEIVDGFLEAREILREDRFNVDRRLDLELIDGNDYEKRTPPLSTRLQEFDVVDIAEYLFYDQLWAGESELKNEARSDFRNLVNELWETYESEFREELPDMFEANNDKDHRTQGDALADFFESRIETLRKKQRESFILGPSDEEIEQREDDLEDLQKTYTYWQSKEERVNVLEAARRAKNKHLSTRADDFGAAADILQTARENLKSEQQRLEGVKEDHREELEDYDIGTHTSIPLEVQNLEPDHLAGWVGFSRGDDEGGMGPWTTSDIENLRVHARQEPGPSINDLRSQGYINKDQWTEMLLALFSEMEEPIEDRNEEDIELKDELSDGPNDIRSLLTIMINDENDGLATEIENVATNQAAFNTTASERVPVSDQSKVRLVGIYANIDFPLMSEFGLFHEYYTDNDRMVSEALFGDGDDREKIDDHLTFAYPRFIDEDYASTRDGDEGVEIPADSDSGHSS